MHLLDQLESTSVRILREAYAEFPRLCMLWSIGKDSTVMLWLVRRAFFGRVPFPLIHIDTTYKIPEMIEYRDRMVSELGLSMIVGRNEDALREGQTFPAGNVGRIECCRLLKTEALSRTVDGSAPRYVFDHAAGEYKRQANSEPFEGVIVGIRADEEGSRSKERYFSPRSANQEWNINGQPPEFWNQFATHAPIGGHVRIHPLLDWTELNVWEYIEREGIPVVPLYFDRGGGMRYRSLGCAPCTKPIVSSATNPSEIVAELRHGAYARVSERAGRAQDVDDGGGLETLRRGGYM